MKNLVKTFVFLFAVALALMTVRFFTSLCSIVAMVARYNGGKYSWGNK